MKQKLRTVAFASLFAMCAGMSGAAQASLGLFFNPAAAIGGLAMMGGSLYADSRSVMQMYSSASTLTFIAGVIVLDGQGSQEVEFTELSEENATELGINENEMKSYNSEIDQVNFILSIVNDNLSQIENANEEDAAALWSEYELAVDPDTFSAMIKIAQQGQK